MNEREWYDRIDRHSALRKRNSDDSRMMRGHCGTCYYTGALGSNNYGPDGVTGYWCSLLKLPVSGSLVCDHWRRDN